jgi:hypothetical protein
MFKMARSMVWGPLVFDMRLTYLVRMFVQPNSRRYRIPRSEEDVHPVENDVIVSLHGKRVKKALLTRLYNPHPLSRSIVAPDRPPSHIDISSWHGSAQIRYQQDDTILAVKAR